MRKLPSWTMETQASRSKQFQVIVAIVLLTCLFLYLLERAILDRILFFKLLEFKTSRLEFDLGVRFTTPFGRRGRVLDNIAFRTQPNVLFFRSHQPDHGWNITSKMIFTSKGMVNVKQFLNSNVTAKKYYKVQSFEWLENLPLKCSDI